MQDLSHLVGPIPQASMQAVNTVSGQPLFTAPGSPSESAPDRGPWQGTPIPAPQGPSVLEHGTGYTPSSVAWKDAIIDG